MKFAIIIPNVLKFTDILKFCVSGLAKPKRVCYNNRAV